jgi:hypothetical protein
MPACPVTPVQPHDPDRSAGPGIPCRNTARRAAVSTPGLRRGRGLSRGSSVACLSLTVLAALVTLPARAELQVRMPTVEQGEFEFEHNGLVTLGRTSNPENRAQSYTNELEYGVTSWWKFGIEHALEKPPGQSLKGEAVAFENTFQITEPGEYFFNLGFFAEYEYITAKGEPNAFTFGPIIQKELPDFLGLDTLHTANFFFTKSVGPFATTGTGFTFAWQSVAYITPLFAPGFEYYGIIEDLGRAGNYNSQQHLIGPVLTGSTKLFGVGNLKYEVGYLFGLTSHSPTGGVRWRLEYEISF